MMTDFNMPHLQKIALDLQVLKVKQAFSYADTLPIMIKVRDELGGAVSNNGWVNKPLTKNDKLKLDKALNTPNGIPHQCRSHRYLS